MTSLVDISKLSTFGLGSGPQSIHHIKSKKDVLDLTNKIGEQRFLVIGSGSNVTFGNITDLPLARMEILGIEIEKEDEEEVVVNVGAGENWDKFVAWTVDRNLSGLEALSAIPGTVGASPIQNIGAYGSEAKDSIAEVEAYDTKIGQFIKIKNKDCGFGYRDSIFKKNPSRFIIVQVTFRLHSIRDRRKSVKIPDYKDVKNYLNEINNLTPTLQEVRNVVIEIRKNKLPDPKVVPNCGSFFKNVFVSKNVAKKIKTKFPDVPMFEQDKLIKIPAGYLIDSLGFKGQRINNIEVYKNNALVLTNPHKASFSDLLSAKETIQKAVFQKFGIKLELEVNIITK